jgi:hypothetical protein
MGSAQSKEGLQQLRDSTKGGVSNKTSDSIKNDLVGGQQTTGTEAGDEGQKSGGCPMKRADGSFSYDWRSMLGRHPHGTKGEKPLTEDGFRKNNDGSIVAKEKASKEVKSGGGCPVKEYNVYSQPIDSTNQMPKVANQLPAPGQKETLSTDRIVSSISKVHRFFFLRVFFSAKLIGRRHPTFFSSFSF